MSKHVSVADYEKKHPNAFKMSIPAIPNSFNPANEHRLRVLQQYDTVFLVDDSTSMTIIDRDVDGQVRVLLLHRVKWSANPSAHV